MIALTDFAKMIEDGLNEAFGDPDIKFKIWADVGREEWAVRTGNRVQTCILANLRSASSANDANILVMGVNALTLEFSVPLRRPWTNLNQTEAALETVQDGQYVFVKQIRAVIDDYFQNVQIFQKKVDDITFTLAMQAGAATTGNVDLAAQLHKNVTLTVNITLYYLEGGINSKDVAFEIDGSAVAVQSLTISRRGDVSSDVYSDAGDTQNYLTSSAVSIDFAFPANAYGATKAMIDYLIGGKKNMAHFVRVKYASLSDSLYLMTFAGGDTNISGISFAGLSGSLISCVQDIEMLDFPDMFQVARIAIASSAVTEITLTVTILAGVSVNIYAAGKFYSISALSSGTNASMSIPITPADLTYDESSDSYFFYVVTDNALTFTSTAGEVQVVKESKVDVSDVPIPDVPGYYRVAVAVYNSPVPRTTTMSLTPYTDSPMLAYIGLSRTFAIEGETSGGVVRELEINAVTTDYVTYPRLFPGKYFLYFMTNGQCMIHSDEIDFQVIQDGKTRPAEPTIPDLPELPDVPISSQIAAVYLDDIEPSDMNIEFVVKPPSSAPVQVTVGGNTYTVDGVDPVGYGRILIASVRRQDFVFDAETGKYVLYAVIDTACGINALNVGDTYIVKEAF